MLFRPCFLCVSISSPDLSVHISRTPCLRVLPLTRETQPHLFPPTCCHPCPRYFTCLTWVKTQHMANTLGYFHHHTAHRITGKLPRQRAYGSWHHPHLANANRTVGLEELEIYISMRQNAVEHYIATMTMMDLYMEAGKIPGARVATC